MILRLLVKSLLIVVLLLQGSSIFAQEPVLDTTSVVPEHTKTDTATNKELLNKLRPTFTAQVSESQYLPPALYGTWQVNQTLISTNAPSQFKKRASDIWILEQNGDKIHLSNPDSGAVSEITVNEVVDNSATFTCRCRYKNKIMEEQPRIKINGNTFSGHNIFRIKVYKKQRLIAVLEAVLTIHGTKISGPTPRIFINSSHKNKNR